MPAKVSTPTCRLESSLPGPRQAYRFWRGKMLVGESAHPADVKGDDDSEALACWRLWLTMLRPPSAIPDSTLPFQSARELEAGLAVAAGVKRRCDLGAIQRGATVGSGRQRLGDRRDRPQPRGRSEGYWKLKPCAAVLGGDVMGP